MKARTRMAATLAVLGLGIAACSSSGNASGGGSSTGAINVMAIGVFQSAVVSLPDAEAGMKAKVQAVNDAGGVNGRKINLIVCNDKFDPNTAANCARQAASKKVVAVVSPYEPYSPQVLPVLEAAKIPYVYGTVAEEVDGKSPVAFPKDAGSAGQYVSLGIEMAKEGCTKVGAVVAAEPNTIYGAKWLERGLKQGGSQLVQVSVGVTAADFSSPVAKLLAEGVDCIVPTTAPDQGPKVVIATRQAGRPVRLGAITGEFGSAALATLGSAADGMILTGQEYRPTDTEVPVVARIAADFGKYQPSVPLTDKFGVAGWAVIDGLSQVLGSVKGDISASSVQTAAAAATPKTDVYATFSYGDKALVPELPRIKNWSYLVWKVSGGKAALERDTFESPTRL